MSWQRHVVGFESTVRIVDDEGTIVEEFEIKTGIAVDITSKELDAMVDLKVASLAKSLSDRVKKALHDKIAEKTIEP